MAHEAVPCPIAKEIDSRQVPPRKVPSVLYRRRRSLRQTCAHREGRANRKAKNAHLQDELTQII